MLAGAPGLLMRQVPVLLNFDQQTSMRALVEQAAKSVLEIEDWQQLFDWKQVIAAEQVPVLKLCFESCNIEENIVGPGVRFQIENVSAITDGFELRLVAQERTIAERRPRSGLRNRV